MPTGYSGNLSFLPCWLEDEDFLMKTVLRMGMQSKFNHTLPLQEWLHKSTSPPRAMGRCYKNKWRCTSPTWNCGKSQILLFYDLYTLLEKWKELNVTAFGSAFPACCRYFLPDSSKMVIHGRGCTFLSALCSLKNQ